MKHIQHQFSIIASVCLLGLAFLSGCTGEGNGQGAIQLADNDEVEPIAMTSEQFAGAGMVIGGFTEQTFSQVVKTTGMFDVPPEYKAAVSAYYGGYVKTIGLLPGQRVKKGQVLFTMENPEYVQMQQDFLEAKGQLAYLKNDLERQTSLRAENVTSQKVFLKAEADYNITQARYESLKKKLSLINLDPDRVTSDNLRSTVSVFSPITGFVTTVHAARGMFLNPADIALTITSTEHLHLELNVFEKDYSLVKAGQDIRFRLPGASTESYRGTVYLINHSIDPESRTANVHGHIANEEEASLFAPGMYIEADIITEASAVLALPEDAIVEAGQEHFVLLKQSAADSSYKFDQMKIQIGRSQNGYTEVLNPKDFPAGAEFLIKGAFAMVGE